MTTIACIVEGFGEREAMPVLLRKLAIRQEIYDLTIPEPIRVQRDRFLNREAEFQRMVVLAGSKAGRDGLVLIVLDADDDCPVELAQDIRAKANALLQGTPCHVAIANREFEAWLLAAAGSLSGKRGLQKNLEAPADPDNIRNAKGWLSERKDGSDKYSPVLDQAALTHAADVGLMLRSRSFRHFEQCVRSFLQP